MSGAKRDPKTVESANCKGRYAPWFCASLQEWSPKCQKARDISVMTGRKECGWEKQATQAHTQLVGPAVVGWECRNTTKNKGAPRERLAKGLEGSRSTTQVAGTRGTERSRRSTDSCQSERRTAASCPFQLDTTGTTKRWLSIRWASCKGQG